MAQYELFSIYDMKAKAYENPFVCVNSDLAVRLFVDLLRTPGESTWSRYPMDFCLYHIGTFDTSSAVLVSTAPALIATGAQFCAPQVPTPQSVGVPLQTTLSSDKNSLGDNVVSPSECIGAAPPEGRSAAQRRSAEGSRGTVATSPGWKQRIKNIFGVSSPDGGDQL